MTPVPDAKRCLASVTSDLRMTTRLRELDTLRRSRRESVRYRAPRVAGTWVAAWLLAACQALPSAADTDSAPGSDDAAKTEAFQDHARLAAAAYEIRTAGGDTKDQAATLLEQPILRWTNPLGGNQGHGVTFLWSCGGRPAAVLSVNEWTSPDGVVHEQHEFCSLAAGGLTTTGPGTRNWSPADAGIELKPVEDPPAPPGPPRLLLRRMRELAERFTTDKTTRDGVTRALRLLPQPVYRYADEGAGVLDGALFAFVEGNDPEVFLTIEWRSVGDRSEWLFGFSRMNSVRVRGFYQDRLVWDAPELAFRDHLNRTDKTYSAFRVRD